MTPTQQAKVEGSIRALYQRAKIKKAPKIVWCQNPQDMIERSIREYRDSTVMRYFINTLWYANRDTSKKKKPPLTERQLVELEKTQKFQRAALVVERAAYLAGIEALAVAGVEKHRKELNILGIELSAQAKGTLRRSERTAIQRMPGMEMPRHATNSRMVDQCHTRLTPRVAYVTPGPVVGPFTDQQDRLHCETGPAVEYADGWKLWSLQGVAVDSVVVEHPEQLTPAIIRRERNMERRRIMMERFGLKNYLTADSGEIVCSDIDLSGRPRHLWRSRNGRSNEPMVAVEVVNSSPEPDGTFKSYVLRVPPGVQTPQEAVAWTFNMSASAYRVAIET